MHALDAVEAIPPPHNKFNAGRLVRWEKETKAKVLRGSTLHFPKRSAGVCGLGWVSARTQLGVASGQLGWVGRQAPYSSCTPSTRSTPQSTNTSGAPPSSPRNFTHRQGPLPLVHLSAQPD